MANTTPEIRAQTPTVITACNDNRTDKRDLPCGWRWVRLIDAGHFDSGGTPSKDRADYWDGSIPFVTGADITDFYVSASHARAFLSEKGLVSGKTSICEPGTVLFVTRTRVGRVGIARERMAASQDLSPYTCGPALFPDYVCHYLRNISDYLIANCRGSTIQGLTREFVEALQIPLPPLSEQRRIAAILRERMSAVERARAAAAAQLAAAQALPAAYLRAVFESDEAQSWLRVALSESCSVHPGQHILETNYNRDGIGIGYLTGPADFGTTYPTITKWTEHPKALCEPSDVLVTVKGAGVGKINFAPLEKVAIGRQLMAVRPHVRVLNQHFLYYALSCQFTRLQSLALGATVPGLDRENLETLLIPLPSFNTQDEVTATLTRQMAVASSLAATLQTQLEAIDALPQALLRQAFAGEL